MACDLEHVTSSGAAERLADYLGHPDVGPLGRPIPGPADGAARVSSESLGLVTAGSTVEVVTVTGRAQVSSFLAASGIEPGTLVTVIASGSGGVLVTGPGGEVHLDAETAATVVVQARVRHGG